MITISVAKNSNNIPVVKQLRRECNTASNIKDSDTRKKVLKALSKLIVEVSQTPVEDGYLMFAAYDGVLTIRPPLPVTRNFYDCGKRFETEYLRSLYFDNPKIGIIDLSTKEAIISIREGEYEAVKLRLTSGIGGQHKKGDSSSGRFYRKREEEINFFFRKVHNRSRDFQVNRWEIRGDKDMVKRYNSLN